MILSAIVAAAEDNAIGKHNGLPWRLPEDLKFFKRITMGKPVLMGRKTFESLGRPLHGRINIVISGQKDLDLPQGVQLYDSLEKGIERMQQEDTDEAFIIGGGKIFEEAMPLIDRLYMTRVHATIPDADVFFPDIDHSHFKLVWEEKHEADEKHQFAFTFQKFEHLDL